MVEHVPTKSMMTDDRYKGESSPLVKPEELESWIIHEDDSLVAINKPGWLVCHPSKNGPWSSLVGALREHLKLEQVYLVGRLDRETSGLVLIAKDKQAGRFWQKCLEKKEVRRSYLAILVGELTGPICAKGFLGNDPDSRVFVKQRVTARTNKSKAAQTDFFPLAYANGYTFCSVVTGTGRKHQIRVHAQSMGFPLVGEKLYGVDEKYYLEFCNGGWRDEWLTVLGMQRQALHAYRFGFVENGPNFVAPVTDDFERFLLERLDVDADTRGLLEKKAIEWTDTQLRGE